jgi:hypothetical protein
MITEYTKDTVSSFQKEIKRVQNKGHIIKISNIAAREHNLNGLEVFLDGTIRPEQIRKVVNYIVEKYKFDACYYTKTHSIKVWYTRAK